MRDCFKTSRMNAEPLKSEDLQHLTRLFGDPEVAKTLGGVLSPEQAAQTFNRFLQHWLDHGFGVWVFKDDGGDFVGYAGLMKTMVEGGEEVMLLYALMPRYWGQGRATEMSQAILAEEFELIGRSNVVAFTLPTNQASRRVMEKLGFQYERDIVHDALPHVLYRLSIEQWRRADNA